jgi:hypothetical protein
MKKFELNANLLKKAQVKVRQQYSTKLASTALQTP